MDNMDVNRRSRSEVGGDTLCGKDAPFYVKDTPFYGKDTPFYGEAALFFLKPIT